MNDGFCMRRFAVAISTLSKLGKQCVVSLSENDMCFVIFEEGVPKRPLAWCTLQQAQFFSDYNIIGVSQDNNQISLQFSPEMFARAIAPLKSPQTLRSLKIKLTKKNTPCLTCEIEMTTMQQHSRVCIHDIPVEVVPRKLWSDLAIPENLKFDLVIQMPNMKRFKIACERMRTLGTHVTIEGSNDGVLALKTEKDLATITTYFKELTVEQNDDEGTDQFSSVKVDFKKVISFLSIDALNPSKILCNIMDKRLLFMHVLHENVALNYFIPGIAT
ncbi:UNVERIFIED_CONTAM: hypothetical protein PYX00_006571 [Menopon gallinae]